MFRASSAHLQQENDVNCTCMQPMVFWYSEYERLLTCTINTIDLLKMSGRRSKHVQELNFM